MKRRSVSSFGRGERDCRVHKVVMNLLIAIGKSRQPRKTLSHWLSKNVSLEDEKEVKKYLGMSYKAVSGISP